MKTIIFIIITLLSGAIAGTLLGLINQAIVEPFIDEAIEIETQNMISEGENVYPQEINNIRLWQKGGEIVAGILLGTSIGALLGLPILEPHFQDLITRRKVLYLQVLCSQYYS